MMRVSILGAAGSTNAASGAPAAIQSRSVARSASESFLPGGIDGWMACETILYKRLSSGLEAAIAGPWAPPAEAVAAVRRSRPEVRAAPWQAKQLVARTE